MKKEKKYRAGKKGQHQSLLVCTTFTPPLSDSELAAMAEEPQTNSESINAMIRWTESLLDSISLPEGTELKSSSIEGFENPLLLEAFNARQKLKLVEKFNQSGDHSSAFNALIHAIPALMNAQLLNYENLVLAGNTRTPPALQKKMAKASAQKLRAKPIYRKYVQDGHSKNRAAELTGKKLGIPKETIRAYFK